MILYRYVNKYKIEANPKTLVSPNMQISLPSEETLKEYNYKPLIPAEVPDIGDNQEAIAYYEETEDSIIQHFEIRDIKKVGEDNE